VIKTFHTHRRAAMVNAPHRARRGLPAPVATGSCSCAYDVCERERIFQVGCGAVSQRAAAGLPVRQQRNAQIAPKTIPFQNLHSVQGHTE